MKIKEKQPFFRVIFRVIFPQKKGFFILKYAFVVDAPKTPETLVNKGKIQHLQGFPHPSKKQITGIEPAFPAWEASVLPMNHICKRNIKYYTPCSFILPVLIFTFLPFYLFAYPFYLSSTPNHFRAFQMPSLSTSVVI